MTPACLQCASTQSLIVAMPFAAPILSSSTLILPCPCTSFPRAVHSPCLHCRDKPPFSAWHPHIPQGGLDCGGHPGWLCLRLLVYRCSWRLAQHVRSGGTPGAAAGSWNGELELLLLTVDFHKGSLYFTGSWLCRRLLVVDAVGDGASCTKWRHSWCCCWELGW
jgi:hypothetical protein